MWDWKYYIEYSSFGLIRGIFHGMFSIPQNIVMNLNNVMNAIMWYKHYGKWCGNEVWQKKKPK